jgi:Tfp pilus assembly protein PilN
MRELEFLPGWYTKLRAKRRILVVEAWVAILIIAVLGLWMILSAHNVIAQEALLSTRQKELNQSNYELQKLSELKSLQQQMSKQADLMSRLGPDVPMGKLMQTITEMLPKGMALLDVNVQFPTENWTAASAHTTAQPDPQLIVQLHGVAPSDIELGSFMWNLSKLPNYSGSPKMSSTDVHQSGHLMRDFQLSFGIKLNDQGN